MRAQKYVLKSMDNVSTQGRLNKSVRDSEIPMHATTLTLMALNR